MQALNNVIITALRSTRCVKAGLLALTFARQYESAAGRRQQQGDHVDE